MNIVFFGSSNFALPSLKALLTGAHKISCVVTQPDKKGGRGLLLLETMVKTVAKEASLKIYQPYSVNIPEAIKLLRDLSPDLFVVIAYGQILSKAILDIPKIFSINVHASLLPKYRGAAPINWAIINGEKTTGITVIKMTKDMDAGQIILNKEVDINNDDTAISLEDRLSHLAAGLLLDSLKSIEKNNYNLTLQDENLVSFAPKLKKEDGLINWNRSAQDIYNLIRGCLPWPGTFTYLKGRLLKIHRVKVTGSASHQVTKSAGEIIQISKDGILVATGGDNLIIEELQIEGGRKMLVEEFIAGHKISQGEILR